MELNQKTSSRLSKIISFTIKLVVVIVIIFAFAFTINKLDLPAPKKEIEKIIPNENFEIIE